MFDIQQYIRFPFDSLKGYGNFAENQKNEIHLDKIVFLNNENAQQIQKAIIRTEFKFELCRNRFTDKDSVIIICSKDNSNILDYTLSKIYQYEINNQHDILLVDDRSISDNILNLSDKYKTSYLRIDNNDNIFNYSVLNNIAASYAQYYNKKLLVFYNNDVWPSHENSFKNIIAKHKISNADLSGCRLVYPTESDYLSLGKPQHLLDSFIDKVYNTIQHGGIFFFFRKSWFLDNDGKGQLVYVPNHLWRFYQHDHPIASSDSRCYAVTGAVHIIDTQKFIDIGGLNHSMSTTFQDIDLCMKLLENNMNINYIGSEYMYHAESITMLKENWHKKQQFISDNILWDYIWGPKLPKILGYQK